MTATTPAVRLSPPNSGAVPDRADDRQGDRGQRDERGTDGGDDRRSGAQDPLPGGVVEQLEHPDHPEHDQGERRREDEWEEDPSTLRIR